MLGKQLTEDLKVKRIPTVCYDCANVINPGGAVVLGESGHVICQKCLSHVLDGKTEKIKEEQTC